MDTWGNKGGCIVWRALCSMALAVFCALAFAFPALADDGELETQAMSVSSAEVSVDGKDYGWLWLASNDCWYDLKRYPSTSSMYWVLGYAQDDQGVTRVYSASELKAMKTDSEYFANKAYVYETLYGDGTLVYSFGPHVRIDEIVAGGNLAGPEGGGTLYKEFVSRTSVTAGGFLNEYVLEFLMPADRTNVKRVLFEDTLIPYWRDHNPSLTIDHSDFVIGPGGLIPAEEADVDYSDAVNLVDLSGWFEDCVNLTEFEGFECMATDQAETMARMFKGCEALEELDLSTFDTSVCTDFTDMFDGCSSLTKLSLGAGWTQQGAAADKRATFSLPMTCQETQQSYAEGDVIPDGAGTYLVSNRTDIKQASVLLGQPGEAADTAPEAFTCEYTGEAVVPEFEITLGDETLVAGVDYTISYSNNIEDGQAKASIRGIGAYYGRMDVMFTIVDTGAYAFLFKNGTLCLKAHHKRPSSSVESATVGIANTYRWFDAATADPGASVPWSGEAAQVERVVVDPSFAAFKPTSMARWFAGCTQLATVEGLENIDTSATTSMAGLFAGCTALAELDLSGLDTHAATDFSDFVQGCSSLESLNLADLDLSGATNVQGFCDGCPKLLSVKMGSDWKNAPDGLAFSQAYFQVAPTYKKHAAGAVLPSGAGEYRLAEMPMQSAKIVMPKSSYDCTGKAIKPKPTVTIGAVELVEGVDYTLQYADNIYPGTAKVTVLGKGVFSGGLVVKFSIKSIISQAGDRVTYKDKIATYTLKVTKVGKKDGHVATANATITKVTVHTKKVAKLALPTSCTIGGVKVTITAVGKKLTGNFRNVKTVVIGSTVTTIGASAFSKASKVTKLTVKTSRLKSAKNCLKGSKITKVNVTVTLTSSKQTSYKKWFTSKSGKSGVKYSYK